MIDALIVYLRAALPEMRGEASTIGREVELARAYAAVLQVPRGAAFEIETRADAGVREVTLPPMVLLPLVQAALACDNVDVRRRFAIAAYASPSGTTISVEVEGGLRPAAWEGEGPEAAGRTLLAYFGATARLDYVTEGVVHRAQIHLLPTFGRSGLRLASDQPSA